LEQGYETNLAEQPVVFHSLERFLLFIPVKNWQWTNALAYISTESVIVKLKNP